MDSYFHTRRKHNEILYKTNSHDNTLCLICVVNQEGNNANETLPTCASIDSGRGKQYCL